MQWPWEKKTPTGTFSEAPGNFESIHDAETFATYSRDSESKTDFSFYWFFLVFWLTVIATVLISWQMVG